MKLCLDENISPKVAAALSCVVKAPDQIASILSLGLGGKDDIEVFDALHLAGFDGLVTRDLRQLTRENERRALSQAGLTWIGIPHPPGRGAEVWIADVATIASAIPVVRGAISPWAKALRVSSRGEIIRAEDV